MTLVRMDAAGDTTLLRLTNGVTNAIGPALVEALSEAIRIVRNESRALVLCGGDKFFCIGFDLPTLLPLDRSGMENFFSSFNRLICELYSLPVPTVCALSGHAIAGGQILALSCDYRFAAEDKKQFGLNEVKLGVPVPFLADRMLKAVVGNRTAADLMITGDFLPTADAIRVGLLDGIFPRDAVEHRAIEKAAALAELPAAAFRAIKANRVEPVLAEYAEMGGAKDREFLDIWFHPEARALLEEASRKF